MLMILSKPDVAATVTMQLPIFQLLNRALSLSLSLSVRFNGHFPRLAGVC